MKMLKAQFHEAVTTLLDSGCSNLSIYQSPGLKTTELVYLSRNGERKSMKVCDSSSEEGRESQRITYTRWLDHAQKSWSGVLNALDVLITYQEACSLVRLTLRNLLASRKVSNTPIIHAQDITRVLVILAQDIFSCCSDSSGAQALSDLLASAGFDLINSSGVELDDALKAFMVRADEEMLLINDRKTENQLDAISVLRVALCQLAMVINDEMVFTPRVDARLEKIKKRMFARCQDEAFQTWFSCHWIAGYKGDMKVQEVLQPLSNRIEGIVKSGVLPKAPESLTEIDFLNREWWGVTNVKTLRHDLEGVYHGYGEFTDVAGVIKIRIKWSMSTGADAAASDVPALVSIEDAQLRVPEKLTLLNPDGEPADFLALVRELAWQEGMSADITSKVFEEMEKNR